MPDNDGGRSPQSIENADHVADEMQDRVLVDRLRRIALAVAAHIGATTRKPAAASASI
jgi:hypothetical protein